MVWRTGWCVIACVGWMACRGEVPSTQPDTPDVADSEGPDGEDPPLEDTDGLVKGPDAAPFQDTAALASDQWLGGAWRDLDDWDLWRDLTGFGGDYRSANAAWGFDTGRRVAVALQRPGKGVLVDVPLELLANDAVIWRARTDIRGHAELWGGLTDGSPGPYSLRVVAGDAVTQAEPIAPQYDPPADIFSFSAEVVVPPRVEVVFVVDARTKGAAGADYVADRVDMLLADVADRLPADAALAFSAVVLDGEGLTGSPFSTDLVAAAAPIRSVEPLGEEALPLDLVLNDLLTRPGWGAPARARVAVLWLGATPPEEINTAAVRSAVQDLAAQGVRLVPVSTDPALQTSFLYRNLAAVTGGRWQFALSPGVAADNPLVGEFQAQDVWQSVADLLVSAATP